MFLKTSIFCCLTLVSVNLVVWGIKLFNKKPCFIRSFLVKSTNSISDITLYQLLSLIMKKGHYFAQLNTTQSLKKKI